APEAPSRAGSALCCSSGKTPRRQPRRPTPRPRLRLRPPARIQAPTRARRTNPKPWDSSAADESRRSVATESSRDPLMSVKFDKDLLIKHKFWVLLGVSVPLILAAIFILSTS